MSLKSRLPKINQVANADTTREIYRRDKYHFAYHVNSIRNGGQFQVIFNWSGGEYPTLTAKLWSFEPKENPHPANQIFTVCYQALGAIKRMCKEQGKTISFCETLQIAKKVKNFGGEIVKIVNPAGGTVWAVVKPMRLKMVYEGSIGKSRLHRVGQTPNVTYKIIGTPTPTPNDFQLPPSNIKDLDDLDSKKLLETAMKQVFQDRVNLMRGPVEMGIE